jgi:serine protease DegQ
MPKSLLRIAAILVICGTATGAFATVPSLDPERGVMTTAPLLEAATPAVVNISVRQAVPGQDNPLFRDPFFRKFFNLPDQMPRQESISAGSGVIVDAASGYVMTNHHVVDNAKEIVVTLKDRRRLTAELVGSDPETDIALLRIEEDGLSDIPMADSDRLKVGDLVFAIGNPFGLGQTVTTGIVSALGRGIGMQGYEDFIQTDASINPGNSGGALVNSKGELIGINTAILAPGGGNIGIGFAVPTNMARAVMDQLIRYGEVKRGRIGVGIQDVTPDLAEALKLPAARGTVLTQVERGSPAEAAGLEPGDVVVALDGREIDDASDLRNSVGLIERGTEVTLDFYREGKLQSVRLAIGDDRVGRIEGRDALPQLGGASFIDIPEDHRVYGDVQGVLVTEVEPGSPSWRIGLREDDVVLAVNRHRVRSLADLETVVKQSDRVVALNVLRGDAQLFLVMR